MRVVLLVVATCAVVLAALWFAPGRDEASERGPAPHARVGSPAELDGESPLSEPAASSSAAGSNREVQVAHPPASAPSGATAALSSPHRVVARAVDPRGVPLPQATLRIGDGDAVGADADGTLEWRGESSLDPGAKLTVHVDADGFARRTLQRSRQDGDTTWLGDVDLIPGVNLVGRVVDASGRTIAGAGLRLDRYNGTKDRLARMVLDKDIPFRATQRETTSDARGSFAFEGVPEGAWNLWAGTLRHRWTVSGLLELTSGPPVDLGDVVLEDADEDACIWARVLAPDGEPLGGVPVAAYATGGTLADSVTSDADGRLRLHVGRGARVRVQADPPVWDWGAIDLADLAPGPGERELRFGEPDWLWARVRDEAGRPVIRGRVQAERAGHPGRRLGRAISDLWDDGRARLHRPGEAFVLTLDAPGFAAEPLGPFEPDAVREPIEIVARETEGLRGRVERDGRGVADAVVELHVGPLEGGVGHQAWEGYGQPFRYLVHAPPSSATRSLSDGSFVLRAVDADAEVPPAYLVVRQDDRCVAVLGPIDASRQPSGAVFVVEVQPSASLEGVLVLEGESPAGWSVRVNDGFRGALEATCDGHGAFRFQELRAGPWQVRAFPPGARFQAGAMLKDDEGPPEWDLELMPGESRRFELRVTPSTVRVVGRFHVLGDQLPREPGVWRIEFVSLDGDERSWLFGTDLEIDASGTFYAPLPRAGPYQVRLDHWGSELGWLHIRRQVDLRPGAQELELTLTMGRFRAHWPDAPSPERPEARAERHLHAAGQSDDGWTWTQQVQFGAEVSGFLPVGPATWNLRQHNYPADARVGVEHAIDVRGEGVMEIELP